MKQAKLYNILMNQKGELCIFFKLSSPFISKPVEPEIIYDGKDHAILYRDSNTPILLDYIPSDFQAKIFSIKSILIVEWNIKTNSMAFEYIANIFKVKIMPNLPDTFISRQQFDEEFKSLKQL